VSREEPEGSLEKIEGWILDLHPGHAGEMTIWVKTREGSCLQVVDQWYPALYVAGIKDDLIRLTRRLEAESSVLGWRFVERYTRLEDFNPSEVLEVTVADGSRLRSLAQELLKLGGYGRLRLYNVDVPPEQMYLYEKNLSPLAYVKASATQEGVSWELNDSPESLDYELPPLRVMRLTVKTEGKRRVESLQDIITQIKAQVDGEALELRSGSEAERLLGLVEEVSRRDPDIILTRGDSFSTLQFLARRALVNQVLSRFVLGREPRPFPPSLGQGVSYQSYGRVYYRPRSYQLRGRVHIEAENASIYHDCGLEGLIEVSRTCRMPPRRVVNTTIGTCMTSLQLYQAVQEKVLIPWKKYEAEAFKTAWELLLADRGGFIFEPKPGVYDHVGEIDFSSMYPYLMWSRNISPETIGCSCCPDSKLQVPELDYNICEKRTGIVPKVLRLLLTKRSAYKRMRDEAQEAQLRRRYDQRQAALKWILVCCFGYLGYRNARFGKIDAHIATCSFARSTLLETARIVEDRGFEIMHGIVDSLWVRKLAASRDEYKDLCKAIETRLRLPVSFEGLYKWIVFLRSRVHPEAPVLNRYYGVFEGGKVKTRGIELQRSDTPRFIAACQRAMIEVLAEAPDAEGFRERVPEAVKVMERYRALLMTRQVDPVDLAIERRLSRSPKEYAHNVVQGVAARQLEREGLTLSAGQSVKYVIIDAGNPNPYRRVLAAELIEPDTGYDIYKYVEMLEASASNLFPFPTNADHKVDCPPHLAA